MRTPQAVPGSLVGRRSRTTASRGAGALALLSLTALLLAGCSPAPSGADSMSASVDGSAASDGSVGAAAPEAVGGAEEQSGSAAADATGAAAAGRQVITSGDVSLVAEDPRAAAGAVVALVEQAGGRVDARQETAAREDQGVPGTADLTVRVPADALTDVLDALEDVGEVQSVDLRSEDVTATAQDLDARIRATRLSVARIEDLLARATTQTDIISAENTLTERQSALEQLESQRARVAEQVALSTLRVSVWATPPPVETETAPRTGFLGGLESGWEALVAVAGVVVLVLGALLPWAVVGAVVLVVVLAVRRSLRRRRGPEAPASEAPGDREPVGAGSPRP